MGRLCANLTSRLDASMKLDDLDRVDHSDFTKDVCRMDVVIRKPKSVSNKVKEVSDIGQKMALTRHLTLELSGHAGAIHSLMYSKDGQYLLTCSADRTIKVMAFQNLWNSCGTPPLDCASKHTMAMAKMSWISPFHLSHRIIPDLSLAQRTGRLYCGMWLLVNPFDDGMVIKLESILWILIRMQVLLLQVRMMLQCDYGIRDRRIECLYKSLTMREIQSNP